MGHAADLVRQRRIMHKKKAEDRSRRTEYEKNKRRAEDSKKTGQLSSGYGSTPAPTAAAAAPTDRQVKRSFASAPLPTPDQEKQLIGHLYQSLRIPDAADALGTLIRYLAQQIFALDAHPVKGREILGSKRGRVEDENLPTKKPLVKRLQSIVNGICTIGDDEDEGSDKLSAIIKDECGNRVLCALLRAIYAHHDSSANEEDNDSNEQVVAKNNKVDAATIALLKPVTESANHLVDLILYLFGAGMIPEDQHTAMRVLVVIADFGDDSHKAKILKYIRRKVKRADAAAAAAAEEEAAKDDEANAADGKTKTKQPARTVSSVLLDRHIANVVLKLLAGSHREATVAWLNNQLLAISEDGAAADDATNVNRIINARQLIHLVEDNVAGNILQNWVHDSNREYIFFTILGQPQNLSALIKQRRGCRFIAQLLNINSSTAVSKAQSALANKMLQRMLAPAVGTLTEDATDTPVVTKKLDVVNMSLDAEANYVAQKVYALLPAVAAHLPSDALLAYKKILELLDNHTPAPQVPKKAPRQLTETQQVRKKKGFLQHVGGYHNKISQVEVTTAYIELAVSTIGCHSLVSLLEGAVGAAEHSNCKIDLNLIIDRVFKQAQAQAIMTDQHGSLVLRKFLAVLGAASNKQTDKTSPITAAFNTVVSVVESHIKELMYDQAGNLVVQQLLASLPAPQLASFYQRFIQKSVAEIAVHASAAHVLVALLDIADAKVHADIAQQLKTSILTLACHLNGRFVVEKLIPNYSDVRETIFANFTKLAREKGTQHVIIALWNAMDDTKAKQLVEKTILPQLKDFAVDPCSSIVIQKLLQDSQKRSASIDPAKANFCVQARAAVVDNASVKKQLLHDRFGRFIIWVLDSSTQPENMQKSE